MKFNDDGTEEDSVYGYNSHSDVEQVTDDQGDTKSTYGYTAYGKDDDTEFSGEDKPDQTTRTSRRRTPIASTPRGTTRAPIPTTWGSGTTRPASTGS